MSGKAWTKFAKLERTIGRYFGVGGTAWAVYTPAGDGITAARTPTYSGEWVGDVVQVDPSGEGQTAGAPILAESFTATGAAALPSDCLIRSRADPTLCFQVGVAATVVGYHQYMALKVPAPSSTIPALP